MDLFLIEKLLFSHVPKKGFAANVLAPFKNVTLYHPNPNPAILPVPATAPQQQQHPGSSTSPMH